MTYHYLPMTQLIRTTSLMGYIDLVDTLGGEPDALLRCCLLDPGKVHRLEGVVSHRAVINLLEESARALECPDFGLRLSQKQDLMILGPLAVIALNSETVDLALQQIARYMRYYAPGVRMVLVREFEPGLTRMAFELTVKAWEMRQIMDLTLGVACNAIRMLCGDDCHPYAVLLKGDPPITDRHYQNFYQAPIQRNQGEFALLVPNSYLDKAIDQSDQKVHDMLEEYLEVALRDEPMSIPRQVESLIVQLLPTMNCNLKTIAAQLGMQPRTLQRQLSAESETFDQLLDRIRRALATQYLAEKYMQMAQVTCLLGYKDQSTFSRSCKRWFGLSPAKKRQQLLHGF